MISDERMEKALKYLAQTDESTAEAKAEVARCEFLAKRVRARQFLLAEGSSVEARKAIAETSPEVEEVDSKLVEAILAYEKPRTKRTTEELVVETWRSINANRRQGNV